MKYIEDKQLSMDGFSLVYAIVIVVIVCILSLTLFSYVQVNDKFVAAEVESTLATHSVFKGLELLGSAELVCDSIYKYKLPEQLTLSVEKKLWGTYEFYTSLVTKNNDTVAIKQAFVGLSKDLSNNIALLLMNSISVLAVANNVRITGDCYVPKGLVRAHANKSQLENIPIVMNSSPDSLPALKNLDMLFKQDFRAVVSSKAFLELDTDIINSFRKNTVIISADTVVIKANVKGNVLIKGKKIIVDNSSLLENVILVGNDIILPDSFTGNVQAFASRYLSVGKNAKLSYPTVLFYMPRFLTNTDEQLYGLKIGNSATINGDIYALAQSVDKGGNVFFDTATVITGLVYSQYPLEFNGKCYGTIMCHSLLANLQGVIQLNLLNNVSIFSDSLSGYYAYASISPLGKTKKIVLWCN